MDLITDEIFLNVPLNERGYQERVNDEPEWPNVFTIESKDSEYMTLYWVYSEWSDAFDLWIDLREEEILPVEHLDEALKILERHMSKHKDDAEFTAAGNKLKEALLKAIEVQMPLFLDF
ncbi:MAG: hypothetical protein IJM30_01740 [Thermoguttaceae bacterium]|nr:hypothetical protein [Thermoguttaceae bacterium]